MIVDEKLIKTPKISIIVTFYNVDKYIEYCVSSILNQTYQNFEIIIVNDGSRKDKSEVLNKIKNEKIKIINLKENSGQLCAFIKGLEAAEGEFICMVDNDDILLPDYLETLLGVHLKNNIALVCAASGEINEKNEITSLNTVSNPLYFESEKMSYAEIQSVFNKDTNFKIEYVKEPFGVWAWNTSTSGMFRKSSIEILKYYPNKNKWKICADKVVFSLLHLVGGSCNISSICYLHRHHNESNSNVSITTGNKRFLSEDYTNNIIKFNKSLRIDTLKMFINNKNDLIAKFNKLNYYRMLCKVIFCINIKVCAKILKTFAHKIIRF